MRAIVLGLIFPVACSSPAARVLDGATDAPVPADGLGADATSATDAAQVTDAAQPTDAATAMMDAGAQLPRDADRDRLLGTYLDRLRAVATVTQSNGLRGADLADVCDLWRRLSPSDRAVFLTLTARLDGAHLGDGSRALAHVVRLYRLSGGQGATATDPGSCGGGEYNRMILSMDGTLHAAFGAANAHQGAAGPGGVFDLSDIPPGGFWRDSHDVGGPHAPFDLSDETNDGGPRGQVQFFTNPGSALANTALGRLDVETVIDPHALEIDQDYDCPHNSNPSCTYTFYGPLCLPAAAKVGTDIYRAAYGDFGPDWHPLGCSN